MKCLINYVKLINLLKHSLISSLSPSLHAEASRAHLQPVPHLGRAADRATLRADQVLLHVDGRGGGLQVHPLRLTRVHDLFRAQRFFPQHQNIARLLVGGANISAPLFVALLPLAPSTYVHLNPPFSPTRIVLVLTLL